MSKLWNRRHGWAVLVAPFVAALVGAILTGIAGGAGSTAQAQGTLVAPGLVLPPMNAMKGKHLFASKGCVVCHQINGVGGTDAPSLDAKTMEPVMNPFEFFAKMWKGAEPMIDMQMHELGHQIEFDGQDLADIVAFAHNRAAQRSFSERDIPPTIKALMEEDEDSESGAHMEMEEHGRGMMDQ